MTANDARSGPQPTTVGRRRWILSILVPAIFGAVSGGALAARVTPVYTSETRIGVVPPRLPESFVPSTASTTIGNPQMISQQILSRTRLERLIKEFDLYQDERRRGRILQDIVEHMRDSIEIEMIERGDPVVFRVAFIGTDPQTVMRVAERVAAVFIQENRRHKQVMAEAAHSFLTANLRDTRRRLVERHTQLRAARDKRQPEAETLAIEYEVLQTAFKDLSAKIEEARIAAEVERTGIGGQLRVIEGARLPERPIAPDWRTYVGGGAGSGAATGGLVLLLGAARPVRRRRNTIHAEPSASDESPSGLN